MLIMIAQIGLKKTFNRSKTKFLDKKTGLNGNDTFFSQFSTKFLIFVCVCFCLHSYKTYCDILLSAHA